MQNHEVVDLQRFRGQETGAAPDGPSDHPHLPAGTTLLLGQYTIEDYLNCGGFGITYIASDSLHRKVAIKECFPAEMCCRDGRAMAPRSPKYQDEIASILRHFIIEAHNLASIRHPNVVHVHQIFEQNDTAYMAMDFIDGPDLLDLVDTGSRTLAPQQVQHITRTMLSALDHIHARGMLHRDISPDNILIGPDGVPVLIDFGAARSHLKQGHQPGARMKCVKDGYSPQEFYIGGSEQGAFSDLYALAATIHHAITGQAPADSQSRLTALAAQAPDPYVPLTGRVTGYPRAFLAALDTALALLPDDRIQTAGDWLDRIATRKTATPASLPTLKATAPASRAPAPGLRAAGLAAAALIGLGGLAAATLPGRDLPKTPPLPVAAAPAPTATPAPRIAKAPEGRPATPRTPAALPGITPAVAAHPVIAGHDDLPAPASQSPAPKVQLHLADLLRPKGRTPATALPQTDRVHRPGPLARLTSPPARSPLPAKPAALPPVLRPPVSIEMPVLTSASATIDAPESVGATGTVPRARRIAALPDPGRDTRATADTRPPAIAPHAKPAASQIAFVRWDVRLPFTTQTEADGDHARAVIDTLDPEAGRAGWIARGVAIHAVNGQPLARGTSLEEAILASLTVDPDGRTRVPVLYRAPGGDMLELGTIEAPVVHRTALADGTVLTTGAENGAPVTRITATGRAPSDLQPGDIVVEEAQTGTWLASPQDIASALETLAGRNAKEAAFTILRDGRRRTASWPLVQP